MKIPANGFTHAGKFHADDVFATALLQILRPDIKITRGFTVPDDFDGIVYDIGFGMFDHHQEPREYRANGVPYAAFGLLWRVLGPGLVGERQARLIDENFIQPLDLNDNTGEQNSLCDAIGFFNPVWDSKEDQDACFFQAVAVAKQILEHQIDAANAVNRADEKVQQAYRNSRDGIVVLPYYLPWKNGLYKTDALFVVYPSQRGGWSAQCVTDHKTKRSKLPFPRAGPASRRRSSSRRAASPASASATQAASSSRPRTRIPPLPPAVRCCATMAASDRTARPKAAFVYMVRCTGGQLYTGWTNDPAARLRAHRQGRGARYTRAHGAEGFAYLERCADRCAALRREAALKKAAQGAKGAFCARRGRPPDAPLRSTARAVPVKSRPKL